MPIGLTWYQAYKQGNPLVGQLRLLRTNNCSIYFHPGRPCDGRMARVKGWRLVLRNIESTQLVQQTHFSNNGLFRTCCCHWDGLGSMSVMSDGAKPDEIAFNFVGVLPFFVVIRSCSKGKGR